MSGQTTVDPLPVVRRMELFSGMSDEALIRVAGAMRSESVPAGASVCREGERAEKHAHRLEEALDVHVGPPPVAALSGLAAFARTPRDFGVAMEGRRWRR
jgi:hypothetical protein